MRVRGAACSAPGRLPRDGRQPWTRQVETLLDEIDDRGGALAVLRGPGCGASRLLPQATAMARDRGLRVLATTAKTCGADVPFAGLRELLHPILSHVDDLPAPQARELKVAFELAHGTPAEPFRIAFAMLELLAEAADGGDPIVLVAEDLHGLDRCTADVLCIMARWLRPSDPVVMLLAGRAARSAVLSRGRLEQLKVGTFGSGTSWPADDTRRQRQPASPRSRAPKCGARRVVP